ncbi:MAG TPA: hypothetical protein VKV74_16060 [Bryobacteraceae bacterium]|nr:hypothetical protein [Bryobacteraceae bacterium]
MAFTDNCDLFLAVHEDGVNLVVQHVMRQRPSWFNFATADVANNPKLWCSQPQFTKDVVSHNNPIFHVEPPVPYIGADSPPASIGFCAQLTKALIDFHPGNKIALPAELHPPLPAQRFSFQFRICGGLECAPDEEVQVIPVGGTQASVTGAAQGDGKPVTLRGRPDCFCLDVFVIGHFEHANGALLGKVDDIDTVDIKPDKLEDNFNCYVKTAANIILREKLAIALSALGLSFPLFGLATVTLAPTPNPPVPNNPAIENDTLKVFITMAV